MIQLQISEESFEYDIRGLLMAFYPHEEIVKVPWGYGIGGSGMDAEKVQDNDQPVMEDGEQGNDQPVNKDKKQESNQPVKKDKKQDKEASPDSWRRQLLVQFGMVQTVVVLNRRSAQEASQQATGQTLQQTSDEMTPLVGAFPWDLSDRSAVKNSLKRLLYQLLKEDTGKTLPWGTLTGIRPTKIAMGLLEEGESPEQITSYMKKEYLVSDEKAALSADIAQREKRILQNIDYEDGYSIYVGIPFCPTTCLYCSFTSYPIRQFESETDSYVEAVEKELAWTAEAFHGKKLNTVYFGGGTPTTLTAGQLDQLLTFVEEHFDLSDLREFTVEAGRPDSITRDKLLALKRHPVSRISINPQSMKQETLDLIGRHHTVEQIRDTFFLARELGFDNINMDIILGLPKETADDVRRTMEELSALRPDNITVHSLAIKRAARLNRFWEQYAPMMIDDSDEMMKVAASAAESLGLYPYYLYRQKNMAGNLENVGYAAPGREGLYNILIMEEKQSIVAIGAGATSKAVFSDGHIERADNVKDVDLYMSRIDEMIDRKKKLFFS